MSSHPLAALSGYPPEGPPIPEREKVTRAKDRHEPGTGRRDRQKRQGRGPSNWGDPIDDALAAEPDAEYSEGDAGPVADDSPAEFRPASEIFAGDDDAPEAAPAAKKVVKVPSDLTPLVKVGDGVEVVPDDAPYGLQKKPKVKPAPKAPYVPPPPEEEDSPDDGPATPSEGRSGKRPRRDKALGGVQHNRERPSARPGLRTEH
jgi:hypothetical protein